MFSQHTVSPLQCLEASGTKCLYSPGVPIIATVPQVQPEGKVLLEWFNGRIIGEQKAHESTITTAEYMIKGLRRVRSRVNGLD